jgi:hypothetical protein
MAYTAEPDVLDRLEHIKANSAMTAILRLPLRSWAAEDSYLIYK